MAALVGLEVVKLDELMPGGELLPRGLVVLHDLAD